MFNTHADGKIPIPPGLFEGEHSSWTYVQLHLHVPWFFCVYSQDYAEEGTYRRMVFLSHPTQLQQLSEANGIELVEVQVVLPDHMTHLERWVMEPLAAIWEGKVPGEGAREQVYVTPDGRRFSANEEISHEDQLAGKRLCFQSPVSRAESASKPDVPLHSGST